MLMMVIMAMNMTGTGAAAMISFPTAIIRTSTITRMQKMM
jgi:hypothetical protein